MDNLPEIPFAWIDTIIVGLAATAFLAIHLWRALRSEVHPRTCAFCRKSVPAADYEHHLEVCGLTKACVTQAPAEPKATAAGGERKKIRPGQIAAKSKGGDNARHSPGLRRDRKAGEDRVLSLHYRLVSESSHLLLLVPHVVPHPDALTIKTLDGTAVLCEAPSCGRPAFYLLSAGKPAVLHVAYCGFHASLFTGGMNGIANSLNSLASGEPRPVPGRGRGLVALHLEDRERVFAAGYECFLDGISHRGKG